MFFHLLNLLKMLTRSDYLNNKCTHREYYAQFATRYEKALVASQFGKKKLAEEFEKNENLNGIALQEWDNLARFINTNMRAHGDYLTLAGAVCILKEAARQVAESYSLETK